MRSLRSLAVILACFLAGTVVAEGLLPWLAVTPAVARADVTQLAGFQDTPQATPRLFTTGPFTSRPFTAQPAWRPAAK